MNRMPFPPQHTASLALTLMVADQRTDDRHRIVFKQDFSCFAELTIFERTDYRGKRRMDWASLLAHRLFTV